MTHFQYTYTYMRSVTQNENYPRSIFSLCYTRNPRLSLSRVQSNAVNTLGRILSPRPKLRLEASNPCSIARSPSAGHEAHWDGKIREERTSSICSNKDLIQKETPQHGAVFRSSKTGGTFLNVSSSKLLHGSDFSPFREISPVLHRPDKGDRQCEISASYNPRYVATFSEFLMNPRLVYWLIGT
jgi:hypothetical protein